MGRYSIGARVRNGGDEGTITGKRKGERRVEFDGGDGVGTWWRKDELEPVTSATVTVGVRGPEPDGVRPEKVANEFLIEAGKTYRTRDGRKVGPILEGEQFNFGGPWFFRFGANHFKNNGESCFGGNGFNNRRADDLVAEWVEPTPVAATEPDIQVGDKVNYWLDGKKQDVWQGTVITALLNEFGNYAGRHVVHGDGHFRPDWILPATIRPGDRVRYAGVGQFSAPSLRGKHGFVRSITDDIAYVEFDSGDYHTCLIENLRAIGDVGHPVALAA